MGTYVIGCDKVWHARLGMTRREFIRENVSALGVNPRLRRLVPWTNTQIIIDRIRALKENAYTARTAQGESARIALAAQPAAFAALLAKLPVPRLP